MPDADVFLDGVRYQETILRYSSRGKLRPRIQTPRQRAIIRSVEANASTSVKGCHGSGKTWNAGGIALHWITRYDEAKVVVIAPTQRQVKNFIGEVELARRDAIVRYPECTAMGLFVSPEKLIAGVSASHGVNVQGYHSPNMLVIVDEAPGVIEEVFDAIHGIRASGNVRMLKLGNPVVSAGEFFKDFTSNRNSVAGMTISAFDTPNLQGLTLEQLVEIGQRADRGDERAMAWMAQSVFPTITRQFVYERYKTWGPTHPKFVARVLGEFPTQSNWSVFSLEWIERAKRDPGEKELKAAKGHRLQWGLDVAGGGDAETSLCARVDGIILRQHHYGDMDPLGKIIQDLSALRRDFGELYPMGPGVVDIVGVGLHLAARIADAGYEVYGFQAGGRSIDGEQFENAKAELYWLAREYFKQGLVSGLDDAETEAQLSAPEYRETSRGKTKIEEKEKMRERLGADMSPDRAEGLIMAFLPITPRSQLVQFGDPSYSVSAI